MEETATQGSVPKKRQKFQARVIATLTRQQRIERAKERSRPVQLKLDISAPAPALKPKAIPAATSPAFVQSSTAFAPPSILSSSSVSSIILEINQSDHESDTSDVTNEEEEYEAWKLRELERLSRDIDERSSV